jgi:hypothetical protein
VGLCVLGAASAPVASASDSLAAPTALAYGLGAQESTAAFGVQAGEQNTLTPFAQTCGSGHSVGVARTAWFSVIGTGTEVSVTTSGSDFDTALFVYSGSPAGGLLTCNDDGAGIGVASAVSFATSTGATYAIQAGTSCNAEAGNECSAPPAGGTLKILATAAALPVTPPSPSPSPTPPGAGPGGGPSRSAPDTSIKSKPKPKTASHQAKFAFTSSASEASFQCSLDGAGYKPCVSPRIVHVGIGSHVFKVRASSAALVDATPASYSWKVVNKHRRHPRQGGH